MKYTLQYPRWISAIDSLRTVPTLALGALLVTVAIGTPPAQAQTYTVVHNFNLSNGYGPQAGLVRGSSGGLYGTTFSGGAGSVRVGWGVVFKLDKSGEKVLYRFTGGADG